MKLRNRRTMPPPTANPTVKPGEIDSGKIFKMENRCSENPVPIKHNYMRLL
jgi:hypothetical protein